jgi:predicted RNA binding protein YcfA (HicA-like mRNA interferase family)
MMWMTSVPFSSSSTVCATGRTTAPATDPIVCHTQICIIISMTSRELLRKLRRLGATVIPARGKGGHVRVELRGHVTHVPTGSGDLKADLVHGILRQLGLTIRDLE